jgi:hypothetical protein
MPPFRSLVFAANLAAVFLATPVPGAAQAAPTIRTPVLVELFTSEGCSTCPPADALLAKLDQDQPVDGANIIVLGEHVDYWDRQGWRDRFSSHQYTERQSQYAERLKVDNSYTPQMIVDGTEQFLGNDPQHALRAIQHAAQNSKVNLALTQPVVDGHKVSASVSAPVTKGQARGDLFAALVDPADTTEVRSGENGGHRLQHAGVVRSLQRVGSLKDLAAGPVSFHLNAPGDAKPEEMRVVVFAQQSGQGAIIGAVAGTVGGTRADTAGSAASAGVTP